MDPLPDCRKTLPYRIMEGLPVIRSQSSKRATGVPTSYNRPVSYCCSPIVVPVILTGCIFDTSRCTYAQVCRLSAAFHFVCCLLGSAKCVEYAFRRQVLVGTR